MIKNYFLNVVFLLTFLLLGSSYMPLLTPASTSPTKLDYGVSKFSDPKSLDIIHLQQDFTGFKEFLGFKESGGSYSRINKFGYMGKYQFNLNTLKMFKVRNSKDFIINPELQEKVFLANCQRNKWILRRDIKWFVGTKINGTEISVSGILAAAHLAGPGNVKKYLRGNGKEDPKDAFGTSISKYMDIFKNYDISSLRAVKKPQV